MKLSIFSKRELYRDFRDSVIKNYLFVSSKNNKLSIFEIIEIGDSFDDGKNPLQFINIFHKYISMDEF